jgi:hypothetical protein
MGAAAEGTTLVGISGVKEDAGAGTGSAAGAGAGAGAGAMLAIVPSPGGRRREMED